MTRAVVFLAAAMVAASLGLVAQDNSGAISNSNQKRNDDNAARNITVTGCLNTSASGAYSLSDEHGTIYALSGNADHLSGHTSQQIEVTGQQQLATNASSGTSSRATVDVLSSRVVADHCSAGSSAQGNRESDASAVASVDDAVNNRQLPQTSTILPLLGLIGLGSLVAGFFARH
jgi:hypothetical protein